ncbi:hypothetical protein P7C73_g5678, partial [Tremellales sp. Uapishka_1]
MPSVLSELDKVRLEPESEHSDAASADLSEEESVVSLSENEDNSYDVDAITYAVYTKNVWNGETNKRENGWRYMVMASLLYLTANGRQTPYSQWNSYLKTASDTLEPLSSFGGDEEQGEKYPLPTEFWSAVGRPMRGDKEPPGRVGEVVECPRALLKSWLKEASPKRSYETYIRRRQKELAKVPLTKADSDYYVHQKWCRERKRAKEIRRVAREQQQQARKLAKGLKGKDKEQDKGRVKERVKGKPKEKRKSESISEAEDVLVVRPYKPKKKRIVIDESSPPAEEPPSRGESSKSASSVVLATIGKIPRRTAADDVQTQQNSFGGLQPGIFAPAVSSLPQSVPPPVAAETALLPPPVAAPKSTAGSFSRNATPASTAKLFLTPPPSDGDLTPPPTPPTTNSLFSPPSPPPPSSPVPTPVDLFPPSEVDHAPSVPPSSASTPDLPLAQIHPFPAHVDK